MAFTEFGSVKKGVSANIFQRPSFLSKHLCTLDALETVKIDPEQSTECYYYVKTQTDQEGYCMIPLIEKGDPL